MLSWRQRLDPKVNQFELKEQVPLLVRIPGIQGVVKENSKKIQKQIPFSLFVGRLSWKCTDEILYEQFQQFRPISAQIVK
jgi:RNA recognition motif-containing protein